MKRRRLLRSAAEEPFFRQQLLRRRPRKSFAQTDVPDLPSLTTTATAQTVDSGLARRRSDHLRRSAGRRISRALQGAASTCQRISARGSRRIFRRPSRRLATGSVLPPRPQPRSARRPDQISQPARQPSDPAPASSAGLVAYTPAASASEGTVARRMDRRTYNEGSDRPGRQPPQRGPAQVLLAGRRARPHLDRTVTGVRSSSALFRCHSYVAGRIVPHNKHMVRS